MKNKWRLLVGVLISTTLIAFTGAISSTLAWYAYATKATVSYGGTTIYNAEQLQAGLKIEDSITDDEFSSMQSDLSQLVNVSDLEYYTDSDGSRYIFATPGSDLPSELISTYLEYTDYAQYDENHRKNQLTAVTSKNYRTGSSLTLYESPIKGINKLNDEAYKSYYIKLTFAFRVIQLNESDTSINRYVSNSDIWISDATSVSNDPNSSSSLYKSLRLYVESTSSSVEEEKKKFILNPSSSSKGSDITAGLLDLDGDGYYDRYESQFGYLTSDNKTSYGKEILYGCDSSGNQIDVSNYSYNDSDTDLDDINKTLYSHESTFLAKHAKESEIISSYDSYSLGYSEYLSIDDIKPSDDSLVSGYLTGGIPVCKTKESNSVKDRIGSFSTYIYLEGWDHSIINQNINDTYNLGLTFQISRVS